MSGSRERAEKELVELRRQFKKFVLLHRSPKLKDLPAFLQDYLDVVIAVVGRNANKEDWNELPEKWKQNTKVATAVMQSQRYSYLRPGSVSFHGAKRISMS